MTWYILYSDCQTEDLFTWVNLHCCIQDYYLAYNLMVYRWQSRLHVVLVEHHHYTSCLALCMKSCYSCAGIQYWLVLVISLLLFCFRFVECVSRYSRTDCSEWKVGVHRSKTWCGAVLTKRHSYRAFWPWWLSIGGAEGMVKKLCHHHLGWYYCSSQVSSYQGLSTGR